MPLPVDPAPAPRSGGRAAASPFASLLASTLDADGREPAPVHGRRARDGSTGSPGDRPRPRGGQAEQTDSSMAELVAAALAFTERLRALAGQAPTPPGAAALQRLASVLRDLTAGGGSAAAAVKLLLDLAGQADSATSTLLPGGQSPAAVPALPSAPTAPAPALAAAPATALAGLERALADVWAALPETLRAEVSNPADAVADAAGKPDPATAAVARPDTTPGSPPSAVSVPRSSSPAGIPVLVEGGRSGRPVASAGAAATGRSPLPPPSDLGRATITASGSGATGRVGPTSSGRDQRHAAVVDDSREQRRLDLPVTVTVAEAPAPGASPAPVPVAPGSPPAAVDQVLERVQTALDQGQPSVRVHLEPEWLGPVDVRIVARSGVLEVHMTAATPQARGALQDGLASLHRGLVDSGFQVERIQVSAPGQTAASGDGSGGPIGHGLPGGQQQPGHDGGWRGSFHLRPAADASGSAPAEPRAAAARLRQPGHGIDYRI